MGNSEVGHLNIGAGRIVAQDLVRVSDAVADGTLASNAALQAAFTAAREGRGVLHVAGLVSDGGVHSHVDHLRAIVGAALAAGVPRVAVHAFTDGRDVSPHQAAGLLAAARARVGGDGRDDRDRRRALLRDGSRPPHRAHRAGTRRDRRRRGGARRRRRPPRSRRATRPASRTSSSSRSCSATRAPRRAGRSARVLQLPPRPRPADLPRARGRRSACS